MLLSNVGPPLLKYTLKTFNEDVSKFTTSKTHYCVHSIKVIDIFNVN